MFLHCDLGFSHAVETSSRPQVLGVELFVSIVVFEDNSWAWIFYTNKIIVLSILFGRDRLLFTQPLGRVYASQKISEALQTSWKGGRTYRSGSLIKNPDLGIIVHRHDVSIPYNCACVKH